MGYIFLLEMHVNDWNPPLHFDHGLVLKKQGDMLFVVDDIGFVWIWIGHLCLPTF